LIRRIIMCVCAYTAHSGGLPPSSYIRAPLMHRTGTLLFIDGPPTRAGVGFCISLVFAVAYREISPYQSPSVGVLSIAANWQARAHTDT
jgi:hypothetical protein